MLLVARARDSLHHLDLSTGQSYANLVNVAARNTGANGMLRVKKGDPDKKGFGVLIKVERAEDLSGTPLAI